MKSNQTFSCLFPQILECEHRHYQSVHLSSLSLHSIDEKSLEIRCNSSKWTINRTKQEFQRLDSLIHTCLVERHFSRLPSPSPSPDDVSLYVQRLNQVLNEDGALSALKCVLILNWLECDNNGFHLICPQDSQVNQRAIGAALVVREWKFGEEESAQNEVFLNLENQEIVCVLENNGFWTKGKKGIQVGLFPSECVQLIDESVVKRLSNRRQDLSSPLVVRRLHRISSLLPQFFQKLVSPERQQQLRIGLKLSELLRPRVFGRDLSEQLFASNNEIPSVVTICSQFIETHGLLDGIYRLSGISSNISRLRQEFDSGLLPDLSSVMADIHCVSSCLKLFFRLLPNPLLTFESYDEFVSCIRDNTLDDKKRLQSIRFLVRRLPPPHFRTVRALMRHLRRVSLSAATTGMTEKNLSIVWAPNLLRSRDIENRSVGGDLAALQVIGIQAVLTEYLIQKFSLIFDDNNEETTEDDRSQNQIKDKNLRIGCFGRQLSERITNSSKKSVIRWKSFESFFTKKDNFFSDFRLNFAKIQTIVDLMRVLPEFERKVSPLLSVWTTTATQKCVPLVTTTTTSAECVVVNDRSASVRNDAVVVKQTSRERIERIKAQRRQQLRQQFLKEDPKPVPTPRKTLSSRLKQVAPKVDTRRPTVPIPTPRRRNSSDQISEDIRILTTSGRTKRNNWNENAIQMLNKR